MISPYDGFGPEAKNGFKHFIGVCPVSHVITEDNPVADGFSTKKSKDGVQCFKIGMNITQKCEQHKEQPRRV